MAIQIGARPDSGFDDPLGMLMDCHRRIEHFFGILVLVSGGAADRPLTPEEKTAVQAALRYFRGGGKRHTADEEESLFPRLRAACAPDELAEVGGLEHDHREADELHAELDTLYSRWIENDALDPRDRERLRAAAARLAALYQAHIQLEDRVLFPRAAQKLSSSALAEIGQEFRARRQV